MNIAGMGVISPAGRGLEALKNSVQKIVPGQKVYSVAAETFNDKTVLSNARRTDKFTRMAVLAAHDALVDSGLQDINKDRLGIIITTAFGPHPMTFKFLDDILSYGDCAVSPTAFSHSVHNSCAHYVAQVLAAHGPLTTITDFKFPLEDGLAIASTWFDAAAVDYVLLCAVEESGIVSEDIIRDFKDHAIVEGAVVFLLTKQLLGKNYCRMALAGQAVSLANDPALYGNLPLSTAFGLAVGAGSINKEESVFHFTHRDCQGFENMIKLSRSL
jgi:hypothetical protein